MTTPPTGGGGPSINAGDDYVAARLSIDIPDGAAEGIREITQEVERYRTTLEAAARAESDVNRYLEQMTEAANSAAAAMQNIVAQQQTYLSLVGRSGLSGQSSGVPGGPATAPFGGASGGSPYATGGLGSPAGERPPNPSDVPAQLAAAQTNNPREYLNMQHARGGVTAQDAVSITPQSIQQLADKIAQREHQIRVQDAHTGAEAPQQPDREAIGGIPQRIRRATGMAGQVANELGQGGSNLGLGRLGVRGLNWLSNHRRSAQVPGRPGTPATSGEPPEGLDPGTPGDGGSPPDGTGDPSAPGGGDEDPTSGLGGVMKLLGPIGAVAGAALTAFGIIQKGGSMVQGMRNVGSLRGGAAGEGAEVGFKARVMAMNPFLTQEQARSIYQAAMSEGYADASGAGADNVIDFMSQNLQKMNIQVADSAKMLRATVVGTGKGDEESVAGAVKMLTQELGAIKTLSRQGNISTPDYVSGVMGTQQALGAVGGDSQGSEFAAVSGEGVFADDQNIKGEFNVAQKDMASSGRGGALLRLFGGPGGTALRGISPRLHTTMIPAFLQAQGTYQDAVMNTLTHFAKLAAMQDDGTQVGHFNAVDFFQHYIKQVVPDWKAASDFHEAEDWYKKLISGEGSTEMTRSEGATTAQGVQRPTPSAPSGGGSGSFQPNDSPNIPSPSDSASQDSGPRANAPSGNRPGGGGGGGGGTAAVQIGLTPEAARLFTVQGPSTQPISPNKASANRGEGDRQVNHG